MIVHQERTEKKRASYIAARERFLAICLTAPLIRADAIICLAGEDGLPRASVAQQLLLQGVASTIVLTGGLDGPDKKSAATLADVLIGHGVSPTRIIQDNESTNTKEQATLVAELATENDWHVLLLVASPQHLVRAALTFIHAVRGLNIRIVPCTANQVPWFGKPEGVHTTRFALLDSEFSKIAAYQELGDVAHFEDGIAHMQKWEGR